MVTTGWHWLHKAVHVYSLPDGKQHDSQNISMPERLPYVMPSDPQLASRADSSGRIYVPCSTYVAVFEISETGNLTRMGNLTAGGELWQSGHISVAVGPETGQLYVASYRGNTVTVVLVNTTSNTIAHVSPTLTHADAVRVSLAVIDTGQIFVSLIGNKVLDRNWKLLYMYRSVSQPPELLAGIKFQWPGTCLGHRDQFLILDNPSLSTSLIRVVSDNGTLLHTVDVLDDRDGVWLPQVADIAIWEDCGWILSMTGSLVLLCPV